MRMSSATCSFGALIVNLSDSFSRNQGERTGLCLNIHPNGWARIVTFAQNSGGAVAKVNLMSKKQPRIINSDRCTGIGGYGSRQL
jgi:hypothetical protein